jgi:hypothetical protein
VHTHTRICNPPPPPHTHTCTYTHEHTHTYAKRGEVLGLWGTGDGRRLMGVGRGHVTAHELGQAKVVHDIRGSKEGWADTVWSDGEVLIWAGARNLTAFGLKSGRVVREFPMSKSGSVVRCLWSFKTASGDYIVAMGLDTSLLLLSLETGTNFCKSSSCVNKLGH